MKTQTVSRLRERCVGALFCAVILAGNSAAQVTNVTDLVNAVNNGLANATVTVGPGTFLLTAPLKPKAGMTIQGAGIGQTILTNDPSWSPSTVKLPEGGVTASSIETGAYLFSLATNTHGVTLSDMTLTGPELHGALYGYNTDNLHLHDLVIQDFRWSGIRTFAMDGANIHDCEFIDAGGAWSGGAPATSGGITGGGMYVTWMKTSEIWNNRFRRTKSGNQFNFYGIKGRQGRNSRIHHNTINVNFSIEFPFENDEFMEIDHNVCKGVISIPKSGGGPVPAGGYTFHIHHNYFTTSYAVELTRKGVEINNNLFDFKTTSDGGNLCSSFGTTAAQGSLSFHDNLVKNPGRGVFWSDPIYNDLSFRNNHIITNTTVTPRTDGLFGFNASCDFSTITIADNIIECIGQTRPLLRNSASNSALISNNSLTNVSGTGNYANPDTGAPRGPLAPVQFTCGVDDEFTVDGWNFFETPTVFQLSPAADSHVRGGTYSGSNYGTDAVLHVKDSSGSNNDRQAFLRFDLSGMNQDAASAKLVLTVESIGGESVTNRPVDLRLVTSDGWSETGVTWSNKPAIGTNIVSFIVTAAMVGSEIELDVTSLVNAERHGDGQISFALLQPNTAGALVAFGSREGTVPGYLEVDTTPPQFTSVAASEDSFTRDGSYASTNYGTAANLTVKSNSGGYNRRSFLKFPVASLAGLTQSNLILRCDSIGTEGSSGHVVELRQVTNDTWSEGGVTWSNQPGSGTLINSFVVTAADVGNEISIDVSSFVAAEAAGDGTASFVLTQPSNGNRTINFSSKEGSNGARIESTP